MTPKSRQHQADKCQKETVKLLRDNGWQVFIQDPLDLICSKANVSVFVELKNDESCKLSAKEQKFMDEGQGLRIVGYGSLDTLEKLNGLLDEYDISRFLRHD